MKTVIEDHVFKEMLFDLDDYPGEHRNVAYRCPEVLAELQGACASWERRLNG